MRLIAISFDSGTLRAQTCRYLVVVLLRHFSNNSVVRYNQSADFRSLFASAGNRVP